MAGASSASELAGVISVGFWPFGLKSHWTSVVANKIAGQARPHEDCSKAKQLRLELLDKRAWVGTQGMIVPWETCDTCVEEKKKKKNSGKIFSNMQQLSQGCCKAKVTLDNKSAVTHRVVVLEMLICVVVTATACCVITAAINTERM